MASNATDGPAPLASDVHEETSPIRLAAEAREPIQSSSPVEMEQLSPSPPQNNGTLEPSMAQIQPESAAQTTTVDHSSTTIPSLDGTAITNPPMNNTIPLGTTAKGKAPLRNRTTSDATGPSIDEDAPISNVPVPQTQPDPGPGPGPAVLITIFLLNGKRHPFKIDHKYLTKRATPRAEASPDQLDPFKISVYTLKELILRDWRDEWDARPTNPGAIRLIFFGKLLDDKQSLRDAKFHETNPNVVHMTVKPQEFIDDEETAKGEPATTRSANARWNGEDEREAGCCRCSVM